MLEESTEVAFLCMTFNYLPSSDWLIEIQYELPI